MKSDSSKFRIFLVILGVLLPPVGIVLLWTKVKSRIPAKVAGSIFLLVLSAVYLFTFFDFHVEMAGSGMMPIITYGSIEDHYVKLEEHRNQQSTTLLSSEKTDETSYEVSNKSEEIAVDTSSDLPTDEVEKKLGPETDMEKRYWTMFRGPNMDGQYQQTEILTDWPEEGLPLLWKQPVGGGYASFVIADGIAFTIEQRRDQEVVAAYELETGKEVWTQSWKTEFRESMGGDGPRATPTWHSERIYALGATGELKVLKAENGDLIWETNILEDARSDNLQWGMSASPLIVDEKVILQPGGKPGRSIVAYHRLTGKLIWGTLDDPQAYTSPMLVELAGTRQIITATAERVVGIDPEKGTLLWDYPWVTSYGVNAAQPVILDENRFFISAGYSHGGAVVEVVKKSSEFSAIEIWQNNRMKNRFSASVLHQGFIYGLDERILACIDSETGKRVWKGGRYGNGQVLLASGHLIVLTEKGELALVPASPDSHQELARFDAIRGKTWNNHAISEGILLVRNANEMAAFRIGKGI